ncbi:nuclear transport factor 2 family protein [Verticiella sediminum]|uniref:Nuclear transport factor 2 family protein n=1 Tax=Verticiella sediminum TaxID=1247510 RepID=A0A556AXQ0_9BURK|nr:nuclear transport factor 2 family protein [Verticiella sediminum]TSH97676.1 nuclear transport factor 2 family protein [Verticiella sediminum]
MANDLRAARIQTVKDHMALECVHEWDKVLDTFQHPRYEMHASGAVFDGRQEVMEYFHTSRAAFPDLRNDIIAVAAADDSDTVLVEFWLEGTHRGAFTVNGRTYEPTGRTFRVRMAASFEFAPGSDKIVCERPYSCQDAKLRSLGLL